MISFIIPVYNGEKFIKRCLDSLFRQTVKEFELIIINDGSTDNSDSIIKSYIEKYSEYDIKYYLTENRGHGAARNLGIEKANKEYIWFVDCDDKLYATNSLAKTIEDLKKYSPDMYIFSVYETDYKRRHKIWNYSFRDKLTTVHKSPFLVFKQQWSWNKLLRRQFIEDEKALFSNKKMFEDIYFLMPLYLKANSIYITTEVRYVYIKHMDALTANLNNFKTYPQALLYEFNTFLRILFGKR